ncbi:MAG: hypothetical protein M3Y33_01690 [Actinomycetota bacterium]|nr:hypothetical protein [Actinomycetota bacterium]
MARERRSRSAAASPARSAAHRGPRTAGRRLPGGTRLLAGALLYSYAVDATTYVARPFFFFFFFFFPQTADGPDADHNIMDTPDVNFSAVLLPSVPPGPTASAAPGSAALVPGGAAPR